MSVPDAASHMAEEVPNPERTIPLVMFATTCLNALGGLIMVFAIIFCTTHPENLLAPLGNQAALQLAVDAWDNKGWVITVASHHDYCQQQRYFGPPNRRQPTVVGFCKDRWAPSRAYFWPYKQEATGACDRCRSMLDSSSFARPFGIWTLYRPQWYIWLFNDLPECNLLGSNILYAEERPESTSKEKELQSRSSRAFH